MVVLALLRRLRGESALAATVAGVVLATSFVFAAVPRLANAVSADGLRYTLDQASVVQRNLVASRLSRLPAAPGDDIFANVDAAGAEFQDGLPASIQRVIDHRTFVVDAPRYRFPAPPGGSPVVRYLTPRYQSGIDDYISLAAGRLPQPTAASVPAGVEGAAPIPLVEVAMTEETAAALNVALGDRLVLEPDPNARQVRLGRGQGPPRLAVDIVGYIETLEPNADYWYGDTGMQRASIFEGEDRTEIFATALFAPSAYAELLDATQPGYFNYSWRYFVDPAAFRANDVAQLTSDVQRVNASYGSSYTTRADETGVSTLLLDLLRQFTAQQRLTGSILSLAAIGLLAIALVVIGLVAAFIAERRRAMVALTRGRGASSRQILGTQVVEGLLLSVPAAALGYLLARFAVRSEPTAWSLYAALGIAAATTALLVATAAPFARRHLRALEREEIRVTRFSPRRAVLEVFVVVLAGAGIYLLRRRGLAGDASGAATGSFDPYLAAVPVLLGLAVGLVVLRLYPLPIRLLGWLAAMRADLVPFLGFRRISRQSMVTAVPLIALLLAVAVAVFSSIMLDTIEVGQVRSSWQRVGADFRVSALGNTQLNPRLDLSEVPGIEATARAYQASIVTSTGGRTGTFTTLLAIETAAYQEVAASTPVDPHFSAALIEPPPPENLGNAVNPIPAIVSTNSPTGQALNPGDIFAAQIRSQPVSFVVREVRAGFTGLPAGASFIVAPLDTLTAMPEMRLGGPTHIYLRGPESAKAEIDAALDAQHTLAILTSRAEAYAAVHDSPLIAGAVRGFRIGVIVAAAYSALAVIVALSLTGRARARDLGYLRTLGLSPRQVLGLTVAEQALPVALALIVGTALGIGIIRLIEPGLDFTAFTGPGIPVEPAINGLTITLIWLGLLAVVSVAVAAVSLIARRMALSGVLRLGE